MIEKTEKWIWNGLILSYLLTPAMMIQAITQLCKINKSTLPIPITIFI